jgi:hypothetical protein
MRINIMPLQEGRYGGHDPGICAHGIGAMGLWFIGQPDTALDMSLAGIRLAENLGHRVSLAHAFEFGGMLRVLRREIDILEEYVYRTYFTSGRGVEALGSVWTFLDLTPFGRQETWEESPEGWPQTPPYEWWRRHDEYEENGTT